MSPGKISNKQHFAKITKGNTDLKTTLQAVEVKVVLKIEEIDYRLSKAEKENRATRKRTGKK